MINEKKKHLSRTDIADLLIFDEEIYEMLSDIFFLDILPIDSMTVKTNDSSFLSINLRTSVSIWQ